MYESLKKHSDDFHLYIFAFDSQTYGILNNLNPDHTTIISLDEFENEELLKVKSSRTRAEYCWTCTSSVIEYVLDKYEVSSCTYLDSDLCFYDKPQLLLDEITLNKSVLITEHRFSKWARIFEQKRAGRFCVQFITFRNTVESRKILKKWISQCIDWCYARYEDGKFGDQKYLETWPDEYSEIHILQHLGGGVAPWNIRQYHFINEGNKIFGIDPKTGSKFALVFFHFHFVRFLTDRIVDLGWNRVPHSTIEMFYKPYISEILAKEEYLRTSFPEYESDTRSFKPHGIKDIVKNSWKRISRYNIIYLKKEQYGIYH
jgi:hypothetical protein